MALSELMLVTDGDKRDCGLSQLFRFLEDSKRHSPLWWDRSAEQWSTMMRIQWVVALRVHLTSAVGYAGSYYSGSSLEVSLTMKLSLGSSLTVFG